MCSHVMQHVGMLCHDVHRWPLLLTAADPNPINISKVGMQV